MTDQPTLFDATKTVATECDLCGATRLPGHQTADGCRVDEQRAMGEYERRPANCLNSPDPRFAEIPF